MSKLERLIEELCPDGVEYLSLLKIANIRTGKLNANEKTENGQYPFFTCDAKPYKINTYAFDTDAIIISGNGSQVGHINKYYGKFNAYQRTYVLDDFQYVCKSFLYYFLKNNLKAYIVKNSKKGSVPYITLPMLENFEIPVPPLSIQEEIVRILDSFTELKAQLEEELEARKKQYEWYRNELLIEKKEYQLKELGSVCTFVRGPFGGALKKEIFKTEGYAVYEQQNAIYQNLSFRYFVDSEKFTKLERFSIKPGDMIVSCSGTIGKTFIIPIEAPKGIINQALLKLTPNREMINVYYLQFFFENTISKLLNNVSRGGAIRNVPSVNELKKIKIPLPSLEEQQRIVDILDCFDKLCNDSSEGLPGEIDARQKQYEHYRDKLLTFKRLGE